ncbi:regucalcin-like [Aphidius gifuensis]|uniref:regucalcin-like n=1 Tax=Aphidius gifuensis TaxID=684658 RepID=UPI001CDD5DA6|nr:regucalcin-like [Aphidius gifuensis]
MAIKLGVINLLITLLSLINYIEACDEGQDELVIEKISGPYYLAEAPHWDITHQVLYFVDIDNCKFYRYNPATNETTGTTIKNGKVGVVVPVAGKNNTFVAGSGTDFVQVIWDPETDNDNPGISVLSRVDVHTNVTRYNDGKVDPKGRFWAGTIGSRTSTFYPNAGTLYRFENDSSPVGILGEADMSNGMVWSNDNKTFYWIDSGPRNVYGFDYDMECGTIENKRVVFSFEENNLRGIPDGMTIDTDGNLWIACNAGGKQVIQVDPCSGEILRRVPMPVNLVSSVAFGGPNLDILYVTTTREHLNETEIEKQPLSGYVFAVYGLGVVGVPMLNYRY